MENDKMPLEAGVSKAQTEVWEWKEKLYQQIKDLPKGEQLKYIISNTQTTIDSLQAARAAAK